MSKKKRREILWHLPLHLILIPVSLCIVPVSYTHLPEGITGSSLYGIHIDGTQKSGESSYPGLEKE